MTEALALYVQHGAPAAKSVFFTVGHTILKDYEIFSGCEWLIKLVLFCNDLLPKWWTTCCSVVQLIAKIRIRQI